jgi:hypothetical protein
VTAEPRTTLVPIATRAFALSAAPQRERPPFKGGWYRSLLVLDTETTIDPTQRLLFGCYRYLRLFRHEPPRCIEEGLFHADDLATWRSDEMAVLRRYSRSRRADVGGDADETLHLMDRRSFVRQKFLPAARGTRALIVMFNASFDLPRLAVDAKAARRRFKGGFSLVLDEYQAESGERRPNPHKERVALKNIDSKREFIELRSRWRGTDDDADDDESPSDHRSFAGHFLDLRTLDFALTNEAHSLERACEVWNVEHPKQKASEHGVITPEYIDYNRADVRATSELAWALLQEFYHHAA